MSRPSSAYRLTSRSLGQQNVSSAFLTSAALNATSAPSTPASTARRATSTARPRSGYEDKYGYSSSPMGGSLSPKSEVGVDMLGVKLDRKRAESDLQLLANRIALLKLEENKAISKVKTTKCRVDEITA
jgi:hypothetical protein